jgi:acyl dehydratase
MNVEIGTEIPPFVVDSVDAERMKTVAALLEDPNPIHWDVSTVRALGMGDAAVNQGPSNLAYIVHMLAAWAGDASRVRRLQARFLGNVFAGERVVARGTVSAVRDEDGARLADLDVWLERGEDDHVLAGSATVLLS